MDAKYDTIVTPTALMLFILDVMGHSRARTGTIFKLCSCNNIWNKVPGRL